jgi:hypothetical protein
VILPGSMLPRPPSGAAAVRRLRASGPIHFSPLPPSRYWDQAAPSRISGVRPAPPSKRQCPNRHPTSGQRLRQCTRYGSPTREAHVELCPPRLPAGSRAPKRRRHHHRCGRRHLSRRKTSPPESLEQSPSLVLVAFAFAQEATGPAQRLEAPPHSLNRSAVLREEVEDLVKRPLTLGSLVQGGTVRLTACRSAASGAH